MNTFLLFFAAVGAIIMLTGVLVHKVMKEMDNQ